MWWKSETEPAVSAPPEPVVIAETPSPHPTSTSVEASAPPEQLPPIRNFDERLSLPLAARLPLSVILGSTSGLFLGIAKGSQDAGFRYRAENAHRLPKTQTGWFLYHKSKNYNMMLGGIVEGMKQGSRFGIWSGLYFVLEEGVDRGRAAGVKAWRRVKGGEWAKGGREMKMALLEEDGLEALGLGVDEAVTGNIDCFSSMFAGLGTAGIFSAWNRFPLPTAARTAKMGAKAGLAFGLMQDLLSLLKGRQVGYIEFIKEHAIGTRKEGMST